MNIAALFCLGLILIVFQTTVFRLLTMPYLKTPLFLSVLIYSAFHMEAAKALILCFLLGYAVDVYSGGVQGVSPMAMIVLCLVGQWMRKDIFVEGKLALGFVAFAFGVLYNIFFLGMESLVEGEVLQKNIHLSDLFIQSLVLAVVCPVLVGLSARIDILATMGWRRLQGLKA